MIYYKQLGFGLYSVSEERMKFLECTSNQNRYGIPRFFHSSLRKNLQNVFPLVQGTHQSIQPDLKEKNHLALFGFKVFRKPIHHLIDCFI